MRRVNLLLVGDIHYPELISQRYADRKDEGFPNRLFEATAPHPLQAVIRALSRQCSGANDVHGLLFCGDLTSWGKLDEYVQCVTYLESNLDLRNTSRWKLEQLHAVPGNHDVNRKAASDARDLFGKFRALEDAWAAKELPILACSAVRSTRIPGTDADVEVHSLNSCLGCGEKRFLPEKVREQFQNMLDEVVKTEEERTAFSLIGEQLDTPAFDDGHLTTLTEQIDGAKEHILPIVLAHHNILSQAEVRYDLYTEVINAGLVRTRLAKCKRAVLYCHGHIHKDPIEIIRTPDPREGPLVSISAPRLDQGFLRLEITFSTTREPIGLTVIPHRLTSDSSVRAIVEEAKRIPFCSPRDLLKGNPRIREYVGCLSPTFQQFTGAIEKIRKVSGKHTGEKNIAEVLLEAEWFGTVEILNRVDPLRFWQIRTLI